MDKQLLASLTSLGNILEEISKQLDAKKTTIKSDTGKALQGGDISNTLVSISESLIDLKNDTKEIKDGQNTILKMLKSRSKDSSTVDSKKRRADDVKTNQPSVSNFFGENGDDKSNKIKDGLSTILLIAVGVMAIGLAFKLVGTVDILSVLAISSAILILGEAFARISTIKNLNAKKILMASLSLVAISIAIVAVSYILNYVLPVSSIQLFTAVMIAGVFTVLSYGLSGMVDSVNSLKNPLGALVILPLVMIAVSYAIMASSSLLSKVTPLSWDNFVTAVGISIVFVAVSFALPFISKAIEKIDPMKIVALPIVMIGMSLAIMASSKILAQTEPIDKSKLFDIVLLGIGLSVIGITMGIAFGVIGKFDNSTMLKGSINLLIIAASVVATSLILEHGTYGNSIPLNWAINTGAVLLVFGLSAVALGLLSMSGAGAMAIPIGAAMTLLIAGTIVATSHILNIGNYKSPVPIDWAMGTGAALLVFGLSSLALGMISMTGVGAVAIPIGAAMTLLIAGTIVEASSILNKGNYTGGPPVEWSKSVALSLGAFGIGAVTLGALVVGTFGLGALAIKAGLNAVTMVAESIVETSFILKKGSYSGGPTKAWAEGISIALGAFAPIYKTLSSGGFFSTKVTPEDMSNSIKTIASGIIQAATLLGNNNTAFDPTKAPSVAWANGVSGAINAFSPVFKFVSDNSGWFSGDATTKMSESITAIAKSLVGTSFILSMGKWDAIIPSSYVSNLSNSITQYMSMIDSLEKMNKGQGVLAKMFGINKITSTMVDMANGIDRLSTSMNNLSNSIDVEKLNALRNLTGTVVMMSLMDSEQFGKMMDKLEEKSNVFASIINSMQDTPGSSNSNSNVKTASIGGGVADKSNQDLYNALVSIDKKLATISTNTNIVSNYINSLSTTIKIKKN